MRIVAAAGVIICMLTPLQFAADNHCYSNSSWTGVCVSNSGSQVDVGASMKVPGSRPATPGRAPGSAPEPDRAEAVETPACDTPPICRGGYAVGMLPDVTLDDLASFIPTSPTLGGEPAGFGVVGLPANIVAAASPQAIPGTVLGWDVVVRFVPTGFVFDYGDGDTRRASTGGATWERLGLAQFSPTATSHVFRERGTYSVSVTVEYAASVDFGSGWRSVAGVVTSRTGGYGVEVLEARTALVERTCVEEPRGPGC